MVCRIYILLFRNALKTLRMCILGTLHLLSICAQIWKITWCFWWVFQQVFKMNSFVYCISLWYRLHCLPPCIHDKYCSTVGRKSIAEPVKVEFSCTFRIWNSAWPWPLPYLDSPFQRVWLRWTKYFLLLITWEALELQIRTQFTWYVDILRRTFVLYNSFNFKFLFLYNFLYLFIKLIWKR